MAANWIDKGGYLAYDRLSAKLRYAVQPLMPLAQFVRDEPVIGSMKGDTVNIPKVYNLDRAYPTSPLSETNPMTETDFSNATVTVTLDEWGDAVPFTEKFQRLSDFDPQDITTRLLMDSMAKNQNYLITTEMKKSSLKYAPTGTAGTAPTGAIGYAGTDPGTWSRNLEGWDILELRRIAMELYPIPPLTGEISQYCQYVLVCSQGTVNDLLGDAKVYNAINAAWTGAQNQNPILRGSLGVYGGVLIVPDTSGLLGTKFESATYRGEALFFGDDAVVSATALYPEIRIKTPQDYGRDKGIGWYGIYNYRHVGIEGSVSATVAGSGQARVIHLGAATA